MGHNPVFRVTMPHIGILGLILSLVLIQNESWSTTASQIDEEEDSGNVFRVDYSSNPLNDPVEVYRPQDDGDWFRVRKERQQERVTRNGILEGEFEEREPMEPPKSSYTPQRRDTGGNLEDVNFETGDGNYPEESVRQRRLYTAPMYETRGGSGEPCQCDWSYSLKYKGASGSRPGAYHVKVIHEETGEYREGSSTEHGYSGGWTSRDRQPQQYYQQQQQQQQRIPQKQYYTYPGNNYISSRPQQQQQQQPQPRREYYVEEVVDDPGDRRDIFQSGRGGGGGVIKTNNGVVPNRMRDSGDGRGLGVGRNLRSRMARSSSVRKLVKAARAVVRHSNWATLAVVSSRQSIFDGYPYTQLCRVADGEPSGDNSTGVPYIYLMPDVIDVASYVDANLEIARVSLTLSLNHPPGSRVSSGSSSEEEDFCTGTRSNVVDHWTCATVTLSGIIIPVTSTQEITLATESLTSRHSQQYLEPDGFFGKLIIKNVVVQSSSMNAPRAIQVEDYL